MKYLLDTHVWIWAAEGTGELPARVREIVLNPESMALGLSAISPWEVTRKASAGRLQFSVPLRQWLAASIREPFLRLLPLSVDVAYESNHLPGTFPRDPADQIIVATARVYGLTLLSCDQRILSYPHVKTLWE